MDRTKLKEEALREACCIGDIKAVRILLQEGVNVNAKHAINGWTPLHWAAKRAHQDIVDILLAHGADANIHSNSSETPLNLCSHPEIRHTLLKKRGESVTPLPTPEVQESHLPIIPNYLRHPNLNESVELSDLIKKFMSSGLISASSQQSSEIVLKIRVANKSDPDFIEVELPTSDLTFSRLLKVCSEELEIDPSDIVRVRKLPNTIVRKDKDVTRLQEGQELEVVMEKRSASDPFVGNGAQKCLRADCYQYMD